jgi:hypothetical protein
VSGMNPFYNLPSDQRELQRRVDRNNADEHFKPGELERLCSLDFHFKEVNNRFKKLGL